MSPVIQAEGLYKYYHGKAVVAGIAFAVQPGECFGILGPNGAGKTTTLRMITGLTPVDAGRLEVFGLPMSPEQRAVTQRLGVVPQDDSLDPDLTVFENLLVYGRYFGLSEKLIRQRIPELLAFAQLQDRRTATVRALSGGMKRRLVLARSLVADPELVVLDEPTTGLDPQARHLIWERLLSLRRKGITLLLTTHYMEEAARLCDRILVMDEGRILDLDTPEELVIKHVESSVVEIRLCCGGNPDPEEMRHLPARLESVGSSLYCYTEDPPALLAFLQHRHDLTVTARPTNLEDVFLRLTGRDLRD
ncbi:MAG: ATP-binding cassette domain-containing protein [Magnetococcales bacterium]|nr:ATP-binding cassette domain-containing protein [Magnetococcales bacterium]